MTGRLRARQIQLVTAIVMMLCVAALLVKATNHVVFAVGVVFFPVFLFGLLELPWLQRAPLYADAALLPQPPILSALFQRPPPVLD